MSRKELSRVEIMGRAKARSLRLCEAVELLELSDRQSKRIWARYRVEGGDHLGKRLPPKLHQDPPKVAADNLAAAG